VADDVGEALDLVIGFAQIRGAFIDGGLEVEVGVAQGGFRVVARPRRTPQQHDRHSGECDDEGGAGDGDHRGQPLRAVRIAAAQVEQAVLLRQHGVRKLLDGHRHVGGRRGAQERRRPRCVATLGRLDLPGNTVEMRFDRVPELADIGPLRWIVRGEALEPVELRLDGGERVLIFLQEFVARRQDIAACRTFGAADFEQQRVGLVLHLDRMDDPGAVVARLVDQQHRGGADHHQHQKSRRKQQDLQQRAPVPALRRHERIAAQLMDRHPPKR
jgi:hypothetical protein